jgi:polysaccharide deacetylase 2 family uncharacterized protein YibQ
MAGTGKGLVPWRPPFSLVRGPVAAYLLVAALTAVSAALVFLYVERPPSMTEGAAMAAGPPRQRVGSLKLPFRRADPLAFRTFSLAERDDMVEETADGMRLPKVSSTGWMPWIANSRRFDPEGPAARVGLLMINVGSDEALMERAIEELPGEVSLAFLAGTPDLPKWMKHAHARDHETYLMMPVDEPDGVGERGIRPIDPRTPIAENVRRLRAALSRGEGYVGVVMSTVGEIARSDDLNAPLTKEIADRGLALIEIDPGGTQSPMARLAAEYGVGYARTSTVLDYKLARNGIGGNLDRLTQWTGETWPGRPPRHDFGVLQPDALAIDAVIAWRRRLAQQSTVGLVPVIGHFECRTACMERLRVQPDQLRP